MPAVPSGCYCRSMQVPGCRYCRQASWPGAQPQWLRPRPALRSSHHCWWLPTQRSQPTAAGHMASQLAAEAAALCPSEHFAADIGTQACVCVGGRGTGGCAQSCTALQGRQTAAQQRAQPSLSLKRTQTSLRNHATHARQQPDAARRAPHAVLGSQRYTVHGIAGQTPHTPSVGPHNLQPSQQQRCSAPTRLPTQATTAINQPSILATRQRY